ncbi:SDR family oxidoreductase [Aldersonia sp. NBC_00410]|uniref:SDR family NAD(P)-dependent oxidoreductase n=1 Tax=Aldersonia sp. NBC_00410 TaxID=2975954 RepID=UPI00224D3F1E|nr:SDR family oxidoreductase [Aldersonia sp. NBC_00410]MCX5046350.1 SDR family oxidoreductase [Aldersonia sp. NBC_00410]
MSFAERTIVVTGAAGGIGAAVTTRLRDAGATVVALDRTANSERGSRAFDVADPGHWHTLAKELAAQGHVHGLVNCAGITRRARVPEASESDMLDAYRINAMAPLLAIQALLPLFGPTASIVNIGSIAALTGHYPVAYTSSKWALRGLTHTAALELGPRGIRVNIVHPGFIDTPMTASAPEEFRSTSIDATSLGRAGAPGEVADVVAFLLGDAAAYVTGSEITVDGGATSHGGVKSISDALRTPSLPTPHPSPQSATVR